MGRRRPRSIRVAAGVCDSRSPGRVGVPPYVVFHDTTLRELARLRPANVDALRHVYGVGARKADDYGVAILQVIAEHGSSAAAG